MTTTTKPSSVLKLVLIFIIWYGFNASYNVYTQKCKYYLQLPYTISFLQLLIGLFYSIPLYLFNIRKSPSLNFNDVLRLLPVVMLNIIAHYSTVVAMFEKGGGSFTHVIKSSEPVVSVLLNLLINQIVPKPLTALSLLPVTYGMILIFFTFIYIHIILYIIYNRRCICIYFR